MTLGCSGSAHTRPQGWSDPAHGPAHRSRGLGGGEGERRREILDFMISDIFPIFMWSISFSHQRRSALLVWEKMEKGRLRGVPIVVRHERRASMLFNIRVCNLMNISLKKIYFVVPCASGLEEVPDAARSTKKVRRFSTKAQ